MHDFFAAINAGNFPAVSFLKAPAFQDAHPGNSDPLDEQTFVTTVINFLQSTPDWKDTAVVMAYDDSDGWYDHVMPPIVNQSSSTADVLTPRPPRLAVYDRYALLRQWRHRASRKSRQRTSSGPLRLRDSSAPIGDFALVEGKLRGSHANGSNFRAAIH